MEFTWVPGGEFQMGDKEFAECEGPAHRVRVEGFWLGTSEVTQAQWEAVMGDNPSESVECGGECPVENVSWVQTQEFMRAWSEASGDEFRLPTEAEWEYAAGGGAEHQKYAGTNSRSELPEYARYDEGDQGYTHPACQKKPNLYGLCDMSGNVLNGVSTGTPATITVVHPRTTPRDRRRAKKS